MAWKPGPGWPSAAKLQYVAALATVLAAGALLYAHLRGRR